MEGFPGSPCCVAVLDSAGNHEIHAAQRSSISSSGHRQTKTAGDFVSFPEDSNGAHEN